MSTDSNIDFAKDRPEGWKPGFYDLIETDDPDVFISFIKANPSRHAAILKHNSAQMAALSAMLQEAWKSRSLKAHALLQSHRYPDNLGQISNMIQGFEIAYKDMADLYEAVFESAPRNFSFAEDVLRSDPNSSMPHTHPMALFIRILAGEKGAELEEGTFLQGGHNVMAGYQFNVKASIGDTIYLPPGMSHYASSRNSDGGPRVTASVFNDPRLVI